MKHWLKNLMFRLMRPGLRDVNARLDRLDAPAGPLHAGLQSLSRQGEHTLAALAASTAAVEHLSQRLARVERRLVSSAVWRGGLSGCAVDHAGVPVPEMTAKYHAELAYWEAVVRRDSIPTWGMPFDEIYGIWQRVRMTELAEFLGIGHGETAMDALAQWSKDRVAIEIGSGPYPSLALVRWKRALAVDPLAEGYLAENLVPNVHFTGEISFLASSGESIALPSATADLLVLENCLDHVDDPALVLAECRRLLRPGGYLWLLVDLMDYRDHMHPNPFSEKSLRALFTAHGFTPVRERIDGHKSHPAAYGEYRGLLRSPDAPQSPTAAAAPVLTALGEHAREAARTAAH